MKFIVDYPAYSCKPIYSKLVDSLDLHGIYPLRLVHAPNDLCLLKEPPHQMNYFLFGCKPGSKVGDDYITSGVWTRRELSKQALQLQRAGIKVGATILDSSTNSICSVNALWYGFDAVKKLVNQYHASHIGADFEMKCSEYGQQLATIYTVVDALTADTHFYATCYEGEADLPALKLLQKTVGSYKFRVNLMAYFDNVTQYQALVSTYIEGGIPRWCLYVGVSKKTTPPDVAVALVQLVKEWKLGGMFFWNAVDDVEEPVGTQPFDRSLFPYLQMLQEAAGGSSTRRISKCREAPARLCLNRKNMDANTLKFYSRCFNNLFFREQNAATTASCK